MIGRLIKGEKKSKLIDNKFWQTDSSCVQNSKLTEVFLQFQKLVLKRLEFKEMAL